MRKLFYVCLTSWVLLFTPFAIAAKNSKLDQYFQNKTGCFLLYDQTHDRLIEQYNPKKCTLRMAANSTFKIPLSVMVFDQHLVNQQTKFSWDGKKRFLPQWNRDQDPHTWLQYSVVWVSQELTPKLGMPTINRYLKDFDYGNQDFSGNPGKHDGLSQAWLSSSLQLSANEQLVFLKRLFTEALPASKESQKQTKKNILLEKMPGGWNLYGKTGSGHSSQGMQTGWFVGCVERGQQRFIFVLNFTDDKLAKVYKAGGSVAKAMVLSLLRDRGI